MEEKQILTFWLLPAEPAHTFFSGLIAKFAVRFDAPIFEPHVTLCVTGGKGENPESVLTAVTGRGGYRLAIRGLDYSDEFTKTLFVQFEPSPEVTRAGEDLQRASASPTGYELNPHLSLLYKDIDTETKCGLAASIALPFSEVIFDSVKAVICPATISSRKDVEAWRVVAERRLTG